MRRLVDRRARGIILAARVLAIAEHTSPQHSHIRLAARLLARHGAARVHIACV